MNLDDRALKSPGGATLILPNRALTLLVVDEWAGQGDEIDLHMMPTTRLAFTVFDRGEAARDGLAAEVARYAGSDLLCYLAVGPDALVARQVAAWGPWLAWARETLGVELIQTHGIMPVAQPEETLARVRRLVARADAFQAMGLTHAASLFGSAVLAFALAQGELGAHGAHALSRLDEDWQEAQWGVDAEGASLAQARLAEAQMLERWFKALRASEDGGEPA